MEADNGFWCGWIEGTSLLAVWDLMARRLHSSWWTLVTMLDSNPHVAELTAIKQLLAEHKDQVVLAGDGVLLNSECFTALRDHGDNFFTGYDEVWTTREKRPIPKPPKIRLTSESAISELSVPGLGRWMLEGGLRLGLGDGFGVNVVTFEASIVDVLTDAYGDALRVADADASW